MSWYVMIVLTLFGTMMVAAMPVVVLCQWWVRHQDRKREGL